MTILSPVFCVSQNDGTFRLFQGVLEQQEDGSVVKTGKLVDLGLWRPLSDLEEDSRNELIQCEMVKRVRRISSSGHRNNLKLVPVSVGVIYESDVFPETEA